MNQLHIFILLLGLATLNFVHGQASASSELEMPQRAPLGYESIVTVKLKEPLQLGKAYEIGFWIFGRQLPDQSYSYPIAVFPSDHGTINANVLDSVDAVQSEPELTVHPPPSYTSRGYFTFTIRPDKAYDHVTIALKIESKQSSLIDFNKDITVTGIAVKALPSRPKDKTGLLKKERVTHTNPPDKIADRILIDSKKTYTVREKRVRLALYDHRRIDDDIVTIYLNGTVAIQHIKLKRKKQFFNLTLQPGKNTITLHAENLGEVAPNTAAILIQTKTEEFMAVLESDLGQSSYFTLVYQKPEP
ncbi:hypothetical protein [uncultured Zobellia sp.]|uniref:hypothetical protein n=1 Tax=uncultured Zobellia sp. TaxID=255433 RepID=UPI002593C31E|nr:hypothetical protein [uncultured Zobellia sp.]